jgi:methyl-accepting chemotaxis protein
MRKRTLSLGAKIYSSVGLLTALMLVLGALAIGTLNRLENRLDLAAHVESRKIELAGAMYGAVMNIMGSQRGILLGCLTNDTSLTEYSSGQLREASGKLKQQLSELQPLITQESGRRLHASLSAMTDEWQREYSKWDGHIRGQRYDEASKMQSDYFRPLFDRMLKASDEMVLLQHELQGRSAATATSEASASRLITLLVCLASIGVGAVMFWLIRGSNRELAQIAGEIAEGSRQVASAAQQVSGSSQALAQGSSEQAASLQETSASTEELNSMTQKNADNARTAAAETEKADQLLKETNGKLGEMVGSMKAINTSSEKISKIIRVIDEIAFQTNILALNAAVEAARAGEAGMGFAVVADEVRNLAQRCAQAARDTSELIEESITRSNDGRVRLDEVASCVSRVFDNASKIRVIANEVNLGSQEQARGIEQIARSVAQMQQVTQSTAANAEESASGGEEMSAQAHSLHDSVARLRLLVSGDSGRDDSSGGPGRGPRAEAPAAAVRHLPALRPDTKPAAVGTRAAASLIPLDEDFKDF